MATLTSKLFCDPDGSPKDITERAFMASNFVSGVGYGIQLVLYTWCARLLVRQRKDRKYSKYIWAYITLLLIVQTMLCVVWARTMEDIYINDRSHTGGTWFQGSESRHLTLNVIYAGGIFSLTFLSDLLVLWRCWVIWVSSGKRQACLVILFPTIVLLVSFVTGILWLLQISQPSSYRCGTPLFPLEYGVVFGTLSFGTNTVLTLLIVLRLWLYRRSLISSLPKHFAKHYVSLATIIVESAALFSFFALLFLILYAVASPIYKVLLITSSATRQISNYLIIFRVADGSAFNSKTLTTQVTTINFARPPLPSEEGSTKSDTAQLATLISSPC